MVAGAVRKCKSDIVLSTLAVSLYINDKTIIAAPPSGGLGRGVERIPIMF